MRWTEEQRLQEGRYEVIRHLGEGGLGLTYLAIDSFLDRQVVIKTPNDKFQADQDYEKYVRRFQREGQTLAKIEHPNVVRVFDFFEEAGVPCLVMAYVEGATLSERIQSQGPLAEDKAVEIFHKLAMALHTLHEADIFHYDIHPGNIILQRNGNPVLIDFGSAKRLTPMTVTVTTTVNYFSPYEQQYPTNQPKTTLEPRATLDIYSLAATLFFAVTGKKPASSINRKLYKEPLESPQLSQPELSLQLCAAILEGMALEEQDRPTTMKDWVSLLDCIQETTENSKRRSKNLKDRNQKTSNNPYHQSSKKENVATRRYSSLSSSPRVPLFVSLFSYLRDSLFISLFLFWLSNIPTGIYLWVFSASLNDSTIEEWSIVQTGILSVIVGGIIARAASWILFAPFAIFGTLALIVVVAGATTLSEVLISDGTLIWASSIFGALTWAGGLLLRYDNKAVLWSMVMSIAWAILVAQSGFGALVGTIASFGISGAAYAGNQAFSSGKETGLIGSVTALAGLMGGICFTSINSVVLSIAVIVLLCFQIALAIISSEQSKALNDGSRLSYVLNTFCVLGMLCGGGIARWFFL